MVAGTCIKNFLQAFDLQESNYAAKHTVLRSTT